MNAHTLPFAGLLAIVLTVSLPAQSDYDLFVKDFGQALKFNNDDSIQKAIRGRPGQAIRHFEALLVSARRSPEAAETYRPSLDKLKAGFLKAFECKTLDHVERYYQRINTDRVNQIYKADSQLTTLYNQWLKAKQDGDRKGVLEIIEHGLKLGRYMEELGHKIKAADVYSSMASYLNTVPQHTLQDTKDTIEYANMFMQQRKGWDWTKDTMYMQWKNWVAGKKTAIKEEAEKADERKKDGLDNSAVGLGGFVDKTATPLSGKLVLKALKSLPEDLCFSGGPVPVNWMSVHVTAKPAKLSWFKKRDVYLHRRGANKVEFALTDRDDAPKMAVEAGAKMKPSLVYLEPGKKDPYIIGFFIGSSQQTFAGTFTNIAPTDDSITIYYRSMSSWVTKLGDHQITFFDDNCDGKLFTENPLAYGFKTRLTGLGPKDDQQQSVAMYDSMRIGKRGSLMPYSSAVKLGDQWWLLAAEDGGKAVQARVLHPNHFHTGTVHMKWSGKRDLKPQFLIIRGLDQIASTAFNIASKKPVEVPVGEYVISYGRAVKGKGGQARVAHIFRGDSEVIKVEKGKNTVVKIGGPFKFDYKKGGDATNVELNSLFFRIKGIGGEVYAKVHGPTPAPEVVAAKSSSGKGAKVVGSYIGITSPDLLQVAAETLDESFKKQGNIRGMGINVGYFPVVKGDRSGSTVMKFKVPFVGALIGLRVKKHKMFGKIEPAEFK